MTTITDVQVYLQTVTNKKVTYTDIGNVLGTGKSNISLRAKNGSQVTDKEIQLLENAYNVELKPKKNTVPIEELKEKVDKIADILGYKENTEKTVSIKYLPDVYLSAGYGVEVYDETAQTITLDARLLVSDKGNKLNPEHCEVVSVSGNSMYPEYRHGDRVIIDRADTELLDGHIFAFRYKGECYVKEINLMGDKLKCISLNKEYDPFYINKNEDFTVLGRILPRIRL